MGSSREEKTERFIKQAQALIDKGVVKSQQEIADKIGISKAMMSNIMNGRAQIPQDKLLKFSEGYTPVNFDNVEQTSLELQMQTLAYLKAVTPLVVEVLAILRDRPVEPLSKGVEQQIDGHLKDLLGISEQGLS